MKYTLAILAPISLVSAFVITSSTKDAPHAGPVRRQLGDTANDLNNGKCGEMMIIFARGTTETGNIGTLVGPPLLQAAGQAIGASNIAMQGVDYPADIPGFLEGGDPAGSQLMAQLVAKAQTQCPSTKVVMSGYSQGGQLVHNAAKMLTASQTALVSSVVIFGDPDNGTAVGNIPASKTLVICHQGDNICQHGDLILAPHLTYGLNVGQAAAFMAQQAGLGSGAASKRIAQVLRT